MFANVGVGQACRPNRQNSCCSRETWSSRDAKSSATGLGITLTLRITSSATSTWRTRPGNKPSAMISTSFDPETGMRRAYWWRAVGSLGRADSGGWGERYGGCGKFSAGSSALSTDKRASPAVRGGALGLSRGLSSGHGPLSRNAKPTRLLLTDRGRCCRSQRQYVRHPTGSLQSGAHSPDGAA